MQITISRVLREHDHNVWLRGEGSHDESDSLVLHTSEGLLDREFDTTFDQVASTSVLAPRSRRSPVRGSRG